MNFSNNPIEQKSFDFSLRIIEIYKEIIEQKEFVLSKQLLRSGISIGANIQEAQAAFSKRDFAAKMSISSKEAREARYWLHLIKHGKVADVPVDVIIEDNMELIRILTSIVKSSQVR